MILLFTKKLMRVSLGMRFYLCELNFIQISLFLDITVRGN